MLRVNRFPYRFAEQVLNSRLSLKQEIEDILINRKLDIQTLSRPHFYKVLEELFTANGWGKSTFCI
jgi:hypothetical protein